MAQDKYNRVSLLTKHTPELMREFTALCKQEGRTKRGYIERLIIQELNKNKVKNAQYE